MKTLTRSLLTLVSILSLTLFTIGCSKKMMNHTEDAKPMMENTTSTDSMPSAGMKKMGSLPEPMPEQMIMDTDSKK